MNGLYIEAKGSVNAMECRQFIAAINKFPELETDMRATFYRAASHVQNESCIPYIALLTHRSEQFTHTVRKQEVEIQQCLKEYGIHYEFIPFRYINATWNQINNTMTNWAVAKPEKQIHNIKFKLTLNKLLLDHNNRTAQLMYDKIIFYSNMLLKC